MANKILKVVFVLLIVVVLSELGIYLYIQYAPASKGQNENKIPAINQIETDKEKSAKVCLNLTDVGDKALNHSILDNLKQVSGIALDSSIITNKYKGIITNINQTGGEIDIPDNYEGFGEKYKYDFALTIQEAASATSSLTFQLNKNMLDKTTLFQKQNKEMQEIDRAELQVGNIVEIEIQYDLKDKSPCVYYECAQSIKIIKD